MSDLSRREIKKIPFVKAKKKKKIKHIGINTT
jgi:hypothetical protein